MNAHRDSCSHHSDSVVDSEARVRLTCRPYLWSCVRVDSSCSSGSVVQAEAIVPAQEAFVEGARSAQEALSRCDCFSLIESVHLLGTPNAGVAFGVFQVPLLPPLMPLCGRSRAPVPHVDRYRRALGANIHQTSIDRHKL